jgi:hypothetical protein
MKPKLTYISGPMSGVLENNSPLFFEAANECRLRGWEHINPAEFGVEPEKTWADYLRRDIAALVKCDAILLLPDWRKSKGAALEYHIAEQLGMAAYTYPSFEELAEETVCQEADRLVAHDRQSAYGHPFDNFTHTGKLWAPILGLDKVTPEQVGLCMIQLKISRECFKHKTDDLVDICGYSKCLEMVAKVRADQDSP